MAELKGFIVSYRKKFLLLKKQRLTDEEFVLRDYCIHIADWDKTHKEKFGTFKKTNKELGVGLGWSESKVSRLRNKLVAKGMLVEQANGRMEIPNFWKYLPKNAYKLTKNHANFQEEIAEMQYDHAKVQESNAEMQGLNENKILGSEEKTYIDAEQNDIELAKMQPSLLVKSDIDSSKDIFNTLAYEEEKKTSDEKFFRHAIAVLEKNHPLTLRKRLILEEQMAAAGFYPDSFHESCFCNSGKEFIDCCGPLVYESLKIAKE